jgi:hypothetical protein
MTAILPPDTHATAETGTNMGSLIRMELLPFYLRLAGLLLATLLIDLALHMTGLVWVGRYLGIPGVLLIILSFGHSLRKRGYIKSKYPLRLLRLHEWLAWIGSTLILVHAGVHFNAVLAWAAVVAMLINIASGLTGKYLVQRAQRWMSDARSKLRAQGLSEDEIAQQLFKDSLSADLIRKWRVIHLPIAGAFGTLAGAHVIAIFLFWGWK